MKKIKIVTPVILTAVALIIILILIFTSRKPVGISREEFALNTFVKITLYNTQDEHILGECFDIVRSYENMLSRTLTTSEVYALNHSNEFKTVSPEIYKMIEKSIEYSHKTSGKYDITIAPIADLWNFSNPVIPDAETLAEKSLMVSYENIDLAPDNKVRLLNGSQIDLGSIAKGYIADTLVTHLKQRGITSAIIDLGGNVYALGEKNTDTNWKIGIRDPFSENGDTLGYFEVSDISVVTSGTYQRYFALDGEIYHHILDPATGYPVKSDLISASIVSKSSTDADALSTSCLLIGLEAATELIENTPDTEAVFITQDGGIFYTSGIGSKIIFVYASQTLPLLAQ